MAKMTYEQFRKLSPEQQKAAFEAQQATAKLTLKVGNSGGVSIYGLQRFPVTLYAAQWERVFGAVDGIRKFIADNAALIEERSARDTASVDAPTVAAAQSVLIPAKR